MIRVIVALAILFTVAQESRVSIRLLPRANETVRFRMTQEMDMDITVQDSDPAAADPAGERPAPASATKMLGKTVFAFTQKTGAPDKDERLPVEVTYDQISVERSVNGVTTPGEGLGRDLVGRTVRMIYDKTGRIVDVKIPPDLAMNPDALKETMTSLLGNLPHNAIAVGETASVPFSTPLPVPTPAGDDLKMTGQMRYTLLSVAKEGTDRIARFEQTVEAKLITTSELALPSGPGRVHISFKLAGAGGLRINLDKGVISSGDVSSTIDGNMYMTPAGSETKLHTLTLHGTTKTSAAEI